MFEGKYYVAFYTAFIIYSKNIYIIFFENLFTAYKIANNTKCYGWKFCIIKSRILSYKKPKYFSFCVGLMLVAFLLENEWSGKDYSWDIQGDSKS